MHVGTVIRIVLNPARNYRWAAITSSQPKTVMVLNDHLAPGGSRSATARAASAGTAILTSANAYVPDPHGPPTLPLEQVVEGYRAMDECRAVKALLEPRPRGRGG
ncbi:hypothetical protein ACFW1F_30670, partial [Streptomyces bungoensis]|uniref:hypothetical protein n=1 Tax=Streptomyces bungoensis TaxID=285568 RepID=UPI00367F684A